MTQISVHHDYNNDHSSAELVRQIGETDQQFLVNPTAELAKFRAHLRVQLAEFSHHKNEKMYFLSEAAVLLEMALMNVDDLQQHLQLSAALGETYLSFYHLTHERRYLTIITQVVKPLAHHGHADILLVLARLSATEQHPSLLKHWLSRLLSLPSLNLQTDLQALTQAREIAPYLGEDWFKQLIKPKLH